MEKNHNSIKRWVTSPPFIYYNSDTEISLYEHESDLGEVEVKSLSQLNATLELERGRIYAITQSSINMLDLVKPGYTGEPSTVVAKLGGNSITPYTLTYSDSTHNTTLTYTNITNGNLVIRCIL